MSMVVVPSIELLFRRSVVQDFRRVRQDDDGDSRRGRQFRNGAVAEGHPEAARRDPMPPSSGVSLIKLFCQRH
jgi:hypothetical protein